MLQSTQNQKQVELIIQQARQESFTNLEKALYGDSILFLYRHHYL
jgi:hypothetical protein